jgi:IS5 family transposase
MARISDETTILRFRLLLKEHNLSIQLLATINATLITKDMILKTGTIVEATGVNWHVTMRPGKRRALNRNSPWGSLQDKAEQLKASVRAKVEHPFRVIKCQFGFTKVRCEGLEKNTAQLMTLFALSNVWMAQIL